MKKTKWEQSEIDFLKENYSKMKIKELSKILNRGEKAINNKCYEYGIKKSPPYTPEEEDFIRREYQGGDIKQIAESIGRTEAAVVAKAKKMGLKYMVPILNNKGEKYCTKCKQYKPKEEFYFFARSGGHRKTGLSFECKECDRKERIESKIKDRYKEQIDQEEEKQRIKEETGKEIYVCSVCGEMKIGEEFKWSSVKLKRENRCKECHNKYQQENKIQGILKGYRW